MSSPRTVWDGPETVSEAFSDGFAPADTRPKRRVLGCAAGTRGREMDEDRIEITMANDLGELSSVAERIEAFCAAADVEPGVAYAVNLALDELLTNIVSYGYTDDAAHVIGIAVRRDGGTLAVTIVDDSVEYDPRQVPETDTDAPLHERDPGGLGLLLVNSMMDSVDYRREDGRNVTVLTKGPAAD